jgi:hypothetical protein
MTGSKGVYGRTLPLRIGFSTARVILDNLKQCSRSNELLRAYDPDSRGDKYLYGGANQIRRKVDLVSRLDKCLGSAGTK